MYGVVTRNEPELTWPEFDRAFLETKDVTGRATEPVSEGVNMISCFGDNAAVEGDPDVAAVSEDGELATRDRPYFDWDYVCPTHEGYRDGLLEMVEDAVSANEDLRLDDVGFPRDEYCHCERCDRLFADSAFEERAAWRASVITGFVAEVRDLVPGRLYLTLYPDPYPGHLYRRAGLALADLAPMVDEFVVPLYDRAYATTYWLEIIASGFRDLLEGPFTIELYAVDADVDVDALVHAIEVADAYADTVLLGYDASNARAALRRLRAEDQPGESFGPD
jgi:hypothetical protein